MTDAERAAIRMQVLTLAAEHGHRMPRPEEVSYLDQLVVWVLTGDVPQPPSAPAS